MAEQAVERVRPPEWLVRIANPVVTWLLRSRWHSPLSGQLMLLHFHGRRTGRTYTTPVGVHEIDGQLGVLTSSGWRRNFEDGHPVQVTLRGQRRQGHATLISDPDTVAEVYERKIAELGVEGAQRRLGLRINVDRPPTHEELRDAAVRAGLSIVRLDLDGAPPR